MWNLIISLVLGVLTAAAIRFGTEFGWAAAVFPALIVLAASYLVLARRTWKRLEKIFDGMQREVQAQKFDRAIETLKTGFVLAPWQFLVAAQLHSNIGILHYIRQEFDAALPHLEKSFGKNWIARGMLGSLRFKRKDLVGAKNVFEDAVKSNKKEGILWSAYAWVLEESNQHDAAIAILARAVAANPSDEKLKTSLQNLQNGKKLKLGKHYGEQWFQFHLEKMPPQIIGPGGGFRGGKRAIYGR